MSREIQVFADWEGLGGPSEMGILRGIRSRGKELFSFTYAKSWLRGSATLLLDPDLQHYEGSQYLNDDERPNFGLFLDSSPDRWGRVLMKRREAILARAQNRKEERLTESDYLLGVHDEQRMGALRFRDEEEGAFLSNESSMAAPPWTSLRELEHASWKVQDRESSSDERSLEWLNLLMAPGSSLGGARPKAGVRDPAGDLWIAKFPGRNDERDMGGWEWVVWQLAKAAGVRVAEAQLLPFGKTHRTFATCRFDRIRGSKGGKRIHFASAMTLLGYNDGTDHAVGASYLELAEFISNHGSDVQNDLRELWRRIVFSICVRNTDDHLRNHGFLLTNHGWELSPAYDLNPDPLGHGLNLNISESDNSLSFDLALEVAPYFRLDSKEAERLIDEVRAAVSSWKSIAGEAGLPRQEQEDMNRAFSLASRE